MTRFLLTLDQAVDTVFAALRSGRDGETYVPRLPAARIVDVAEAMIGGRPIEVEYTGIRPGEKIHEVLVSEEEAPRTQLRGDHFGDPADPPRAATRGRRRGAVRGPRVQLGATR